MNQIENLFYFNVGYWAGIAQFLNCLLLQKGLASKSFAVMKENRYQVVSFNFVEYLFVDNEMDWIKNYLCAEMIDWCKLSGNNNTFPNIHHLFIEMETNIAIVFNIQPTIFLSVRWRFEANMRVQCTQCTWYSNFIQKLKVLFVVSIDNILPIL